jgi:two-component system phosphate regulon sensor histidine kinase PhoR
MKMLHNIYWRAAVLYAVFLLAALGFLEFFLGEFTLASVLITLLITVFAFLATLLLAESVVRPAKRLGEACRRLARGELYHRADISSNEVLGGLVQEFNEMAAELEKRINHFQEERNKMVAIMSTMTDGVIITSSTGEVKLINPAAEEMLCLRPGKAIGRTFVEVTQDHELAEILERCLKTRKQQTKLVERGRQRQLLRMIATPTGDSETTEGLVVLQDLTELRRLETMRREFVTNISHELRNPLASLKAVMETLKEGAIEDPMAAKVFLHRAEEEVNRLIELVQELGELSRIETGQATLKKELKEIEPLLHRIAQQLQVQADRAGLKLSVEVPSGLPPILMDEERIEQVVVNLLHNAIKFTPPGGSITLSAESRGSSLEISVADTGVGIPAEDLPHVFERFYKADKSRASEGMGLGLAIAKHIVQAHGGSIRVESTEGKGSVFTFTLPVSP